MSKLADISLVYSPGSQDILLLQPIGIETVSPALIDKYRVINQQFYDVLEAIHRSGHELKFNSRGKNYTMRLEEWPR